MEMSEKISHDPQNEKELIATKDFIDIAPSMVEKNCDILREVYRHIEMLEVFSYMYKEVEIESYWYMKVWPMKIQVSIQDGKNMIGEKNEQFGARLESEKETFQRQVQSNQEQFTKIKEFKSLDDVKKYFMESFNLKRELEKGFNTVRQFHEREDLFGLPRTPYPDLDDIQTNFKPFFDLISMANEAIANIYEWTTERLAGRDAKAMADQVAGWTSSSM
jgi:dynein heavy chain